jgi:hypothetical protein
MSATCADPTPDKPAELLEDGQEEVFSRTAVEHGFVKDPNAMGPVDGEEE